MMDAISTPAARFENLPDYPFLPHYADIDDLMRDVGFKPATPIETGIEKFITWYRDYYKA